MGRLVVIFRVPVSGPTPDLEKRIAHNNSGNRRIRGGQVAVTQTEGVLVKEGHEYSHLVSLGLTDSRPDFSSSGSRFSSLNFRIRRSPGENFRR